MSWNKKQIKQLATLVKNGKGNNIVKYNSTKNFRLSSVAHVLTDYIMNNDKSSWDSVNIKQPSNPSGDTVKGLKVVKKDYLDMCQRFTKYCKNNKVAPNYVKVQEKQISFNLFAFNLAKITLFIIENNRLPAYTTMDSSDISNTTPTHTPSTLTSKFVSKPHLTTTSEGLGQDTGYWCSCNSVQQALYKLSNGTKKISEKTLASVGGVTTSGVGHEGINTMIAWFNRKYGYNLKVSWKKFSELGDSDTARFKAVGKLLSKKDTAVFFHIGYHNGGVSCSAKGPFGHYEMIDTINISSKTCRALNSLGSKRDGTMYAGFLNARSLSVQKCFINDCSQKSVCIISKE